MDDGSGFGMGYGGEKGAAGGCGGGGGWGGAEMAFKVLASPHACGKIIGRGGTEIANLRQQCGINCRITKSCYPNTGCQVVILTGTREGIEMSFGYILQKLLEADSDGSGQGMMSMTVMSVLTSNAVSAVIGNKGSTIAQLRMNSGCNISADKENINGEQVLRITGAMENLPYALAMVTPLVERSGDSMQYMKTEYDGGGKGGPGDMSVLGFQPPKGGGKAKGCKGPAWPAVIGKASYGSAKGYDSFGMWQKGGQVVGAGPASGANGHAPIGVATGLEETGAADVAAVEQQFDAAAVEAANPWDFAATVGFGDGFGETPEEAAADATGPKRGEQGFQSSVMAPEDPAVVGSMTTINFSIPKESIGRVLGKGGEASAEIRRETGVSLKITPTEMEGVVSLSGTLQSVHRAHCMVVARVLAEF